MTITITGEQRVQLAEKLGLDPRRTDFADAVVGKVGERVEAARLRAQARAGREARARLDAVEAAEDRTYAEWAAHSGFDDVTPEDVHASYEERLYAELVARTGA